MGPWMIMYIISSLWCWPKHWNKMMFFSNKWYVDIFKLQPYDIFLMQPLFKILFCYLYMACNDSQGYGSLMFETFFSFIIPLLCSTKFIIWGIFKHLQVIDCHFTGIFSLIDYVGMLVTFHDSNNVSSLCNGPLQHCINLHIWYCTFPLTSWSHHRWCNCRSSWLSASWLFMLTLMSKISAHVCMRVVLGNILSTLLFSRLDNRYFLSII